MKVVVYLMCIVAGAFCWPYVIENLGIWFHHPIVFCWLYGAILSVIPGFGKLSIFLSILVFTINTIF